MIANEKRPADDGEMAIESLSRIAHELGQPRPLPQATQVPVGLIETIDLEMTNFDHRIDDGLDELLKSRTHWSRHNAWNFNGRVWWDGEQFCEEVWVYHVPQEVMKAPTLRDLMELVNDKYGSE